MGEYQILLCIYKFLEDRFDKNSSDEYLLYLSSLDPYVRGDGSTANHACFESFMYIIKSFFKKDKCSLEDGLQYAKMYLKEYNRFEHEKLSSDIDEVERVFSECTLDEWTRIYDSLPNSLKSNG